MNRFSLTTALILVVLALSFTAELSFSLLPFQAKAQAMELSVPPVSQVPDGLWTAPWDEACEEASVTMLNGFYQKKTSISKATSKREMQAMITWENATFKENRDTNATQILQLIDTFGTFDASIQRNPSLQELKHELDQQQPVIALVDLYKFYNERPKGDSYHVFVVVGYDDQKNEFIVNDPGRDMRRYSYERIMNALHDYNAQSKEATGEPTVLFTKAKPSSEPFFILLNFFRHLFG